VQNQAGESKAALATLGEIDKRFGKETSDGVRLEVAEALVYNGEVQAKIGDVQAARKSFDEALLRCENNASSGVRWVVDSVQKAKKRFDML